MKDICINETKEIIAGGGKYEAKCTMCPQVYGADYIGAYGGLSWSMAKVLCEGQLKNHMTEHYGQYL